MSDSPIDPDFVPFDPDPLQDANATPTHRIPTTIGVASIPPPTGEGVSCNAYFGAASQRRGNEEYSATPDGFPIPIPLSELGPATPPDWAWVGYLAHGYITELIGLWKAGKTTLLAWMLKLMESGGCIGQPIHRAKVLIVTEEPGGIWSARRDELGIGDHVHIIAAPAMMRPNTEFWFGWCQNIADRCRTSGYNVVIFDTIAGFWPVLDENDATEMGNAVKPLRLITGAGAGVLIVHHPKKGDAGQFQSSRGSGALTGAVDIIVEVRRFNEKDNEDRRRVIVGVGRFPEQTPAELVIELNENGYGTVGKKVDARRADRQVVIDSILPDTPPGLTVEEINESWPKGGDAARKPSKDTIRRDLNTGVDDCHWKRTDPDYPHGPFRYWRGNGQVADTGDEDAMAAYNERRFV